MKRISGLTAAVVAMISVSETADAALSAFEVVRQGNEAMQSELRLFDNSLGRLQSVEVVFDATVTYTGTVWNNYPEVVPAAIEFGTVKYWSQTPLTLGLFENGATTTGFTNPPVELYRSDLPYGIGNGNVVEGTFVTSVDPNYLYQWEGSLEITYQVRFEIDLVPYSDAIASMFDDSVPLPISDTGQIGQIGSLWFFVPTYYWLYMNDVEFLPPRYYNYDLDTTLESSLAITYLYEPVPSPCSSIALLIGVLSTARRHRPA